jgi:hypothetical protein
VRKLVCLLLICGLLFSGTTFTQKALAGHGGEKWLPPGIAKKLNITGDFGGNYKGFKLTRAQLAKSIALKKADFANFQVSQDIIKKITDWEAIEESDRKAVGYVVSKGLMEQIYQKLPNGKILFQPNKPVTWEEVLLFIGIKISEPDQIVTEVTYEGTVRLIEKIGNKTWIAVKTTDGLYTAYYTEATKPSSLTEGMAIKIKVDKSNNKIIDSNVKKETKNLLTLNQSNVENNLTGFLANGNNISTGAKLERVTSEKWQGGASLQVTTIGGSDWQGVNADYQGAELSGTHTFSFYVKAPKGTPLRVMIYDVTNSANSAYPSGGTLNFTATGKWERKAVTFTPFKATKNLSLQVTLNNTDQKINYYLDGLQLEKGKMVTDWITGRN